MDLMRDTKTKARRVISEEGLAEPAAAALTPPPSGLRITLQERFTAVVSRVGAIRELALEGRLSANCAKKVDVELQLAGDVSSPKFRFKLMQQPKGKLWVDRRRLVYNNSGPKSAEATLLCWRMTSTDETDMPISVSCWIPQTTREAVTFSCEVELKRGGFRCDSVTVIVPLASPRDVRVAQCDGQSEIFERDGYIRWTLEAIDDDNPKAEIEFTVPPTDEDAFYPVVVAFEASQTICNIAVTEVVPVAEDAGEVPELTIAKSCTTNKFEIE
jgi:hypothetical protein